MYEINDTIEDSEILEGFLCPICKTDLETIRNLHAHFQDKHEDDLDVLKFFKGMVGQAKKILKSSTDVDDLSVKKDIIHNLDIYFNEHQDIGVVRSHMNDFKEFRSRRLEGYAAETNKLIIRLDKLLLDMPTDPAKKKMHEQTVVPWLDGQDVPRCPNCTRSFHLARRQHHCRLCGSIMCHECSRFLPIHKAKQVLSRPLKEDAVDKTITIEQSLRLCGYCIKALESREQMKASRNCNPIISQLYEHLREYMTTIDKHAELYCKMSTSLNAGESKYNLKDGQELWGKILKLAETVDQCSTKISNLNNADNSNCLTKELHLQKAIRLGATAYIRARLLTLPGIPSEQKYIQLQNRRRRQIEEQIRKQKLGALMDNSAFKTESVDYKPTLSKLQTANMNEGWSPDTASILPNEDPLIEQMNNIQHYIKQAREALRFDEVASLEKHLTELKEEYFRRCQDESSN